MSSDINNAEIPQGVTLYDWEDFDTSRNLIQNDVKDTLAKQFALKEHNGVQLSITDLKYVDPEHYSISDQKKALHNAKQTQVYFFEYLLSSFSSLL